MSNVQDLTVKLQDILSDVEKFLTEYDAGKFQPQGYAMQGLLHKSRTKLKSLITTAQRIKG